MNMITVISFIICVIVILYLIYKINKYKRNEKNLLCGFWSGDLEYYEDANLSNFILYLGEPVKNVYSGYIVIVDNEDNIILNSSCSLKLIKVSDNKNTFDPYYYKITFTFDDEINMNFDFPLEQNLRYYPICHKLVFYKNDTIYAVLFKNLIETDLSEKFKEECKKK